MNHRNALFSLVTLGLVLCSGATQALDLLRPEPTSFHCRGFGYVAEIFPPKSRRNPGDKPLCYLYRMGYPGATWQVDARLKWKAALTNDQMPHQALVSGDGLLVTLNEYSLLGGKNSVVIYSSDGEPVKSWHLDKLIPEDDPTQIRNMRGRWWNREARYYFLRKPARLYILLKTGSALEFSLQEGSFKYGAPADFPDLAAVMEKRHPDEEAEVWATSLRFSSVTDVLGIVPEAIGIPVGKLSDKKIAEKIEEATSAETNPHARFEAVLLLAIDRFTPKSAEALTDIACNRKMGRTTRGYAVMGLSNFSKQMPIDMKVTIRKRLRETLATEVADTPDGIIRMLIKWGNAGHVQEILGDKLAGHKMEIEVLEATRDPEASARLWQLYLNCPRGPRSEHYQRRSRIGWALVQRKDKRGIDILMRLLPAENAPSAQHRNNNYNFIARNIGRDFGYKGNGNYRRSLEKAVPKMIDWWKKSRDEFEFRRRPTRGFS